MEASSPPLAMQITPPKVPNYYGRLPVAAGQGESKNRMDDNNEQ